MSRKQLRNVATTAINKSKTQETLIPMKAPHKLIMLAAIAVATILITPVANAGTPYVTRGEQFFKDFEKKGSPAGDKIDRSLRATSPRQNAHEDSLKKVGQPCGDMLDRSLQRVPGKAKWLN